MLRQFLDMHQGADNENPNLLTAILTATRPSGLQAVRKYPLFLWQSSVLGGYLPHALNIALFLCVVRV